jgi:cytochrome c oxidase cbb3-type subunit 2
MRELNMGNAASGKVRLVILGMIAAIAIVVIVISSKRSAPPVQGDPPKGASAVTERLPIAPSNGSSTATPDILLRGKTVFFSQCAVCHGVDGAGKGEAAYLLFPKPRNLTQRSFRLVSNLEGVVQVEDIFRTITRGMPGSAMPSWEILPEQDRWAVSHYVNSLSRPDKRVPKDIPFGVEPPATAESVEAGRKVFLIACAACHGADAKGTPQQPQLDTDGYPSRPRDLTRGIFKGGRESRQIFSRIAAGMLGSPMPSQISALDNTMMWNVVHYVQSLSAPAIDERNLQKFRTLTASSNSAQDLNNPNAEAWTTVTPTTLAMMPLWWRDDHPEVMDVRTVHDARNLYVRLSWNDPTHNDEQTIAQGFRDGVAVELAAGDSPPQFAMGAKGSSDLRIWYWKADRQADISGRHDVHTTHPNMYVTTYPGLIRDKSAGESMGVDFGGQRDAKTKEAQSWDKTFLTGIGAGNVVSQINACPVESLTAHGFGTLDARPVSDQGVDAKGGWDKGTYSVVFSRPLQQNGEHAISLKEGDGVYIAFACWDGSAGDRNGQKNVTIWQRLQIAK